MRWMQFTTPLLFTFLIGGGLTTLYALGLFLPLSDMLERLADVQ